MSAISSYRLRERELSPLPLRFNQPPQRPSWYGNATATISSQGIYSVHSGGDEERDWRQGREWEGAKSKVISLQVSCHLVLDWICVQRITGQAPRAECHATRLKDWRLFDNDMWWNLASVVPWIRENKIREGDVKWDKELYITSITSHSHQFHCISGLISHYLCAVVHAEVQVQTKE